MKEKEKNHEQISGNKTEKNLQAAFARESQARNKYLFSSVAKKEEV